MMHRFRAGLALLGPLWGCVGAAGAAELPAEVAAACLAALPRAMAEGLAAGATSGSGPAGEWRIEAVDLDGDGAAEAFLVVEPAEGAGEVRFLARRGDEVATEKVKVDGGVAGAVSIRAEAFAEGRAFAHVEGAGSGQVLLHWDGRKLATVWSAAAPRTGERHWFDVEDLNGDGTGEVVAYFHRALDEFFAEEQIDETSAGDTSDTSSSVDAVAVFRFDGGKWKKDADLLEGLR
jgi:hypothetical protein